MIDYNEISEEERREYIESSIFDLTSLMELLDMFENILINEESEEGDHINAAWLIKNLKQSSVECMDKSIIDLGWSDDVKN